MSRIVSANSSSVRPADGSAPERPPGRVTHDSRGNAVWDWDIATGVLAHKSVSELLTSLDAPGALTLDPSRPGRRLVGRPLQPVLARLTDARESPPAATPCNGGSLWIDLAITQDQLVVAMKQGPHFRNEADAHHV